MTTVLVDAEVAGRLTQSREQLQLCDPAGKFVGLFVPAPTAELYRSVQVPFSDEELDRAEAEPGGRSLAAILADLEKS